MTQSIITYYIPQNLNITKGRIYNLYLNKVTNLDLSSIITINKVNSTGILQPNNEIKKEASISITEDEYNKIISLINASEELYNESKELAQKFSKGRTRRWIIIK